MITLGLTGSIGMGKSTTARMMAQMGCAVHDSDAAVRHALQPMGQAFAEVAVTFKEAWDKKNHVLKKDILAKIIFDDAAKRKKLEEILHPIVRASQTEFMRQQKRLGRKFIVLDIPLLFETAAEERVDYTIVVTAPHFLQKQRVLRRANMTEEKFAAILETQMSDREKRRRADYVLSTGLGLAYTHRELKKIFLNIKKRRTP
jgi:dephospho-CoA kinase